MRRRKEQVAEQALEIAKCKKAKRGGGHGRY